MSRYYFAYGSNLHPVRLTNRIEKATVVSKYTLRGYKLLFNKSGQDDSAKCNIQFTDNRNDEVLGVIYEIDDQGLEALNEVEGFKRGYTHHQLQLSVKGSSLEALAYIAMRDFITENDKPFQWYKDMVVAGMEFYSFEADYILKARQVPVKQDPDPKRRAAMSGLLTEISNYEI